MGIKRNNFEYIQHLVKDRASIEIVDEQSHWVESGVSKVVESRGYESATSMIDEIREDPNSTLAMQVIESMTVNETSFFRDHHPFEALRNQILPKLIERKSQEQSLKIWSAACSSGQEAYSLGITILEDFPELKNWDVSILATDISREMVTRTKLGYYSEQEISRGLPPSLRDKYFSFDQRGYQVKDCLRPLVRAQVHNLVEDDWRLPSFDLVLARNILIYFDLPTKQKVLKKIKEHMAPWALLFLGAGETTVNIDCDFSPVHIEGTRCFQTKASQ